jgi:hypothetical protein
MAKSLEILVKVAIKEIKLGKWISNWAKAKLESVSIQNGKKFITDEEITQF